MNDLRFVAANRLRFGCLEAGRGPLVLLVHGFPDTAHTWDAALPRLAEAGFRAVAPNTRGYPPTEAPADGDYRRAARARDLVELIAALGEERAIVVGHDWGADAAYEAARLAPERIRLLVTVAIPYPAAIRPTPTMLWKARHFVTLRRRDAAARLRRDDFALVDELVRRWSPTWDVPPDATAEVKRAFREPGAVEAALGYYRAASLPSRAKIAVPTVCFAGTDDFLGPAAAERARRWFTAGYQVVAMPGAHFLHREHPDRFADELLRVLAPYR